MAASCPSSKYHNFKLENNNVKCESCSMEIDGLPCVANCNVVKCESDYKCNIMKCEQCMKEGQIAMEMDKDSGIVLDDKLDGDPDVKEELDVVVIDSDENWKKPDYESTVQETVDDKDEEEDEEGEAEEEVMQRPITTKVEVEAETEEQPKCQKVTKRKLSLDSLSDSRKKRKLSKRALSVGSSQDANNEESVNVIAPIEPLPNKADNARVETTVPKKKQAKKEAGPRGQKRKAETPSANESATKKVKSGGKQNVANCLKRTASDISIMETINDVIQQSLQMTQRKDRKSKNCERVEKKRKSVKEESLPAAKRPATKKIDQVKEQAIEKVSKAVSKNGQVKSKTDAKPKLKATHNGKVKVGKGKIGKIVEAKAQDTKPRAQDLKARDGSKKRDIVSKTKASDVSEDPKKNSAVIKKRRKSAKKVANAKKSGCKVENASLGNESLTLTRKTFLKPKWNNGWSWEGEPFEAKVYLTVRIIKP